MKQVISAAIVAVCSVLPAAAEVAAQDAQEMVEMMIGQQPARYDSPLAAMQGEGDLYDRLKNGAVNDHGMGLWLLYGQGAVLQANGALSGAFISDMEAVYGDDPALLLGALDRAPWLVPTTCYFLGAGFDFEGRGGAGREAFLALSGPLITAALAEPLANICLEQIAAPERPELK
ncbi:hypothetical protein IV417_07790 [Alphaproteobacteria bacterium KMM 3653]|uniref:Uncharacterized protein n=1 Tax=Harenicola maris TaxID=2841044 RepID=A0AAP2G7W5_9RHOB|nr:hypothetical protein [Harenicola maris]